MRSRAYYRHQRARTKARHIRDYYELSVWTGDFPPPKDVAVRHPRDCGRSRCGICHCEKVHYPPRRRVWERDAMTSEWVATGGW